MSHYEAQKKTKKHPPKNVATKLEGVGKGLSGRATKKITFLRLPLFIMYNIPPSRLAHKSRHKLASLV